MLSRARVYVLKPLDAGALRDIVERALADPERGLGGRYNIDAESLDLLAAVADGDARRALNLLELAADLAESGTIDAETVREVASGGRRRFDKRGE